MDLNATSPNSPDQARLLAPYRVLDLSDDRGMLCGQLLGDLGRWAMGVAFRSTPKLSVVAGWGRVDVHLEQCAQDQDADLLVVGTHQRNRHEPIWQNSVSRSALNGTRRNVLCVPEQYLPPRTVAAPRVIVVPTDLTALSDRAIRFGASLHEPGSSLQ